MTSNALVARSMSYRKPVPDYVPSPSPSPTISAKESELEDADGFQLDVPPLPENWREIISTKIQEGNSSKVSVHTFKSALTSSESDPSKKPLHYPPPDENDQNLVPPPAALRSSHRKHSTRGFPTHYRSPTPPLPSSKPPRMSPEGQPGAKNFAVPMLPYNIPSSPGLENIQLPAEARSLRHSYSFQTDRTAVSHGTGRVSTPWSRSFGTLVYGEPSNRSTNPKKEVGDLSEIINARNDSESSLLCCGLVKVFCWWK